MTGTSITKKPLRQVQTVQELFVNEMAQQQLALVAAAHMRPERMMRLMANAVRTTPKLAECTPLSLLGGMMTCASIGLEPNTILGHAFLIPFENRKKKITEVQLVLGYKGMIALARRSGNIVSIHADVVYQGDEFSFEYGSNQHLRHVPLGRRETPTHAYCYAKLTDGEAFTVLPWDVVLATRDQSQGYRMAIQYGRKDNPWISHLHQMARKTAIRNLFSELPISIEQVGEAMEVDERRADFGAFALNPTDLGSVTVEGEASEIVEPESAAGAAQGGKSADGTPAPTEAEKAASDAPSEPVQGKKRGNRGRPPQKNQKAETPAPAPEADKPELDSAEAKERIHLENMAARIKREFETAKDAGAIEAILQLFDVPMERLLAEAPDLADDVNEAADALREQFAAASEG